MVAASSPAVLKRWIGVTLRQLRKEAGKSRPDVAARLKISRTAVGHLETARNLPSAAVLEVLLNFYGKPERLEDFLNLVEAARKGRNWWERLSGAVPRWFDLYLGLESGAASLSSFDALLVPGLLQTPDYAEAVIRADPDLTDEEVQQRVELRTGRQRVLERQDDPMRLWAVLDESVLHRQPGSAPVLSEQLEHLLVLSDKPRIDIQVLPLDAGTHMAQQGGTFTLMKFPPDMVGDPGLVYHELMTTGLYFEEPEDIAVYERTMSRLHALAATQKQSRTIIQQALKEVKT